MNVVILAAGFGTRLYPLTKNLPKALIKLNGKPLLNYIMEKVKSIDGLETIYIVSNNKFYINFLEWIAEIKLYDKIKIINNGINSDQDKKGAIYDLKNALRVIPEKDLFLLAGDNLFEYDLNRLSKLSKEKNTSTVALKNIYNPELIKKYSCVLLDENNKIALFEEKPKNPKSDIAALACYFLKKEDLKKIKQYEFKDLDNFGNVISFLYKETNLYGIIFNEFWADIGSFEEIAIAEQFIKNHSTKRL